MKQLGVTAPRSAFIVGISSGEVYRPVAPEKDASLKESLRRVWRPNMGYRMAHALVRAEFAPLNIKRVHRVWKEGKFGRKRRYSKLKTGRSVPFCATCANEVWTVDFIFDSCFIGTKLKILSVVDEFTRECLALDVSTRLDSAAVRSVLAPLFETRGAPRIVRSDNGGEFVSRMLSVYLSQSQSGSHFTDAGKPWQNSFVESFHATLRRDHLDVEAFCNLAEPQIKTAIYRRITTRFGLIRPLAISPRRSPRKVQAPVGLRPPYA